MFSPSSLLLLLAAASCVHCYELNQPGSMTVQPGQVLSINCKVSYSVTSYDTAWIRQAAGEALEWIGFINSGGSTAYSDKLKNKFSISRDTSSNTITLRGQNVQAEDSAVYYCARFTVMLSSGVASQKPSQALSVRSDEIRLDQLPTEVKKPGEHLKISCKITGFDMTSYLMHWILQKPGKALEWIGYVNSGSSDDPTYAESMKARFKLSEDVQASTQYLEIQSLRAEDTAVYYCARQPQ
ncbi:immunoglobulin alpha-2 heavy chain-like [Trichomycterus rosablanca]|uniref:immunoglobulin alpha-2 heavy chain-like n=1 Tax=Trichomycterus rosablanca TaxID=2290929 RepID=UPI002F35E906